MLPAPNLDDRTFQGLVDEAKRLVQDRCPEWTDHNVSDPGVTLIEAFAQMVDQLIYRLNRVPDLNYVKFLELIGVRAAASRHRRAGQVTFWLSAPQPQPVLVRAETQVATPRTDIHEPVVFTTLEDLPHRAVLVRPSRLGPQRRAMRSTTRRPWRVVRASRRSPPAPAPGDAMLVGLTEAVPSCAVTAPDGLHGLRGRRRPAATAPGVGGVDRRRVDACEVDRDETGGLNKDGDVVLHVPEDHQTSIIARERAGWLRCRLVATLPGQPTYTAPPRITAISAFTIGGTAPMIHAEVHAPAR